MHTIQILDLINIEKDFVNTDYEKKYAQIQNIQEDQYAKELEQRLCKILV